MRPVLRSVALCLMLALSARAQDFGSPLGELRLSFEPQSLRRQLSVAAQENFHWYVQFALDFGSVQRNAGDGLLIWESGLTIPPEITVLSVEHVPNVSFCDGCSATDWRALLASCVFAKDTPTLLMRFEGRLLQAASDLTITLEPAPNSNFGGTAPGWRVCANSGNPQLDLHPFGAGWSDVLWVNRSVGTSVSSWSTLKGRY